MSDIIDPSTPEIMLQAKISTLLLDQTGNQQRWIKEHYSIHHIGVENKLQYGGA
jgi:hypothetical protein